MSSDSQGESAVTHLDDLLDQALADSFPASDPLALTTPRRPTAQSEGAVERRLDYFAAAPEGLAALRRLQLYLDGCGLDRSLLELIKIRASQLNGCAYCLDMHTQDALAAGETTQRLMALSAWRETPFFSRRERAALAWTEALTTLAGGVPDRLYDQMQQDFTARALTDLTLAVVAINGWNRLAISFRTPPGSYRLRHADKSSPVPA